MRWRGLALAALAAGVAAPVLREALRRDVARGRPNGPGFARLSQGVTHYRWFGPGSGAGAGAGAGTGAGGVAKAGTAPGVDPAPGAGPEAPVTVAVHGLTTPSQAWDAVAEGLAAAGHRVLVYDLYGRGLSDAPPGAQDAGFFLRQLDDLLADQGVTDGFGLIGYSMGGAIVTAFAARAPGRVGRLGLVAPAGVEVNEDALGRAARRLPLVGDWLHLALTPYRMRRALTPTLDAPTEVPGIARLQLAELERRGFLPAVLSSARAMLASDQQAAHSRVAEAGVPVAAVWAAADEVIPLRAAATLTKWNREVRQEVIAGAGHGLPYTHGRAVAEALLRLWGEDRTGLAPAEGSDGE